jgi:hypothetical protein
MGACAAVAAFNQPGYPAAVDVVKVQCNRPGLVQPVDDACSRVERVGIISDQAEFVRDIPGVKINRNRSPFTILLTIDTGVYNI